MSSDVTANSRTVVHRGDGIINVSALPDVCKTPTPAGPTPVPYPNVARSADLADGAKHVTIAGNPVALEDSKLGQSSGDEAGTLGGVVSGKNRGKMTWGSSSPDVIVEGKRVIRFADLTHHNCNSFNVIDLNDGSSSVAVVYGDDAPCPICGKERPDHPAVTDEVAAPRLQALIARLGEPGPAVAMIAVATCQHCDVVCAAFSNAPDAAPGTHANPHYADFLRRFATACAALGYRTETSLAARFPSMEAAVRKILRNNIRRAGRVGPRRKLALRLQDVLRKIHPIPREGNAVAKCAGPRALALAMLLHHQPASLCEVWYGGGPMRSKINTVQRRFTGANAYLRFQASLGGSPVGAKTRLETRVHGQQVPSCNTCTRQIPALLCQKVKVRCAKR